MTTVELTQEDLTPWAGLLAFWLRRGDAVLLSGDLGAGKTTLARALVRAMLADEVAEVPSPTFPIVQIYETTRFPLAHYDFYRLNGAAEVAELGFDEALADGAVVVEWPERAPGVLPPDCLLIELAPGGGPDTRLLTFHGRGSWADRLDRMLAARRIVEAAGWRDAAFSHLQGDASSRAYARLHHVDRRAILMDAPRQPDGPPVRDGLPYSRIAHLAEDVRPFVAMSQFLRRSGFSAPEIYAHDLDRGLLLLEDLGDRVYGAEVAAGVSQPALWIAATDVLQELAALAPPTAIALPVGPPHVIPPFDRSAMTIEVELLLDWYLPFASGASATPAQREAFLSAWKPVFELLEAQPRTIALRDYHSPNLLWLPDRNGSASVGLIDFQDALIAPPGYDLASLLQDARLDVPADLETALIARFEAKATAANAAFDLPAFRFSYRALAAQRATKIIGIFARLALRDKKPGYLRHLPRMWRYLERDLAAPELAALRSWYDRELPPPLRVVTAKTGV